MLVKIFLEETMYNDYKDNIPALSSYDADVAAAMARELGRQRDNLELIASENIVSPAVLMAMGSYACARVLHGGSVVPRLYGA